jgi:hypothetical protein
MRCGGQLVSDPSARRAPGALLLRNFLGGPQELTITDGATDDVRRMWEGLGGRTAYLSSLSWTRVFRPAAFVGGRLATRSSSTRPRRLAPPLWRLVDAPVGRLPPLARTPQPAARGEPLTPEGLLEHLEAVADGRRIRPDYDLDFLRWLFDELPRVETRGELVRMLVRAGDRVLGWYVVYLRPHDSSAVLQIAAHARDVGSVIDHLFRHARERGAAALQGRWEPHLFEPLWRRGCIIRHDARALVHSRDPELLGALTAGDALLTRMEGEWWMGHHTEPFDGVRP